MGISENKLQNLQLAGLLHDIGKIGTPEYILNKPGKLTDAEFDRIKEHPERGANIIGNLKKLGEIIEWVRAHHERYDGNGYPDKKSGKEIPLGAAILAVADTYDAMTSDRSYRKGLPHEVAVNEIKRCSGSQFNPVVAEAFLKIEKEFEKLAVTKSSTGGYVSSLLMDTDELNGKICS
jgi:putative nucleotidyltransferase with HDIG domain